LEIFRTAEELGMEEVVFCHDRDSGLKAIIAIHDTTLGPALGGTRMKAYAGESEALLDACRLARAMTHKAALADLDLGGGKAVILGDPAEKSEALLRAYGRFVHRLGRPLYHLRGFRFLLRGFGDSHPGNSLCLRRPAPGRPGG